MPCLSVFLSGLEIYKYDELLFLAHIANILLNYVTQFSDLQLNF